MTAIEIKAKIYDLQEKVESLNQEKEKVKSQLKERLLSLSEDYFLTTEIANAVSIKDLAFRYEEVLKEISKSIDEIENLKTTLTVLEE